MWRTDAAGNVVGMVPVTVPSDFKPGTDRLSLATVPPIPGQYRHWDDLPELAKRTGPARLTGAAARNTAADSRCGVIAAIASFIAGVMPPSCVNPPRAAGAAVAAAGRRWRLRSRRSGHPRSPARPASNWPAPAQRAESEHSACSDVRGLPSRHQVVAGTSGRQAAAEILEFRTHCRRRQNLASFLRSQP